jgi:two-component system, LytTR family, response regulator
MPIKVIITDDEEYNRDELRKLLSDFPDIEIVSICKDGFETVTAVQQNSPDLIFLDINMPRLSGFDVLELLGDLAPPVVFVTAYDEHALRAFETSAIDYVLKPVSKDRLQKAINKFLKTGIGRKTNYTPLLDNHKSQSSPIARILIKDGPEIFIVPVNEIVSLKAEDDYVAITSEKKTYLKQDRLSFLESVLDKSQFCRIHRSYILNINFLTKLESQGKDTFKAVLRTGAKLPVSASGFKELLRFHQGDGLGVK